MCVWYIISKYTCHLRQPRQRRFDLPLCKAYVLPPVSTSRRVRICRRWMVSPRNWYTSCNVNGLLWIRLVQTDRLLCRNKLHGVRFEPVDRPSEWSLAFSWSNICNGDILQESVKVEACAVPSAFDVTRTYLYVLHCIGVIGREKCIILLYNGIVILLKILWIRWDSGFLFFGGFAAVWSAW